MRPGLVTLAAGVSAALCVAVFVLWARSYFAADYYLAGAFPSQPEAWRLVSQGGAVRFERAHHVGRDAHAAAGKWRRGSLGFSVGEAGPPLAGPGVYVRIAWVSVPHWAVALPVGAVAVGLTAAAARWRRRDRRLAAGLCPQCGYDLRASPDRCPECGSAAAPAQWAST